MCAVAVPTALVVGPVFGVYSVVVSGKEWREGREREREREEMM